MKHGQDLQVVKWALVHESLINLAEVNQTLAANLHRGQLIAQVIQFRWGNEVPKVVNAEAWPNVLLLSFLWQGVEIVEIRKEEALDILVFEKPKLIGSLVKHVDVWLVKEQKVLIDLLDSLLILQLTFKSYFFIFIKNGNRGVEVYKQIIGSEIKWAIIVIWISENSQARYYPNPSDCRLHFFLNIVS